MANRPPKKNEPKLRLILPKKGRLAEDFNLRLAACALAYRKEGCRLDYGTLSDESGILPPTETLLQRSGDALANLADGLAQLAVVGRDTYEEFTASAASSDAQLAIAARFNECSACAMWLAAPANMKLEKPQDLAGKRIVTSYPNALRRWLQDNGVADIKIISRDGGIEDYVRLGLADAVCDVVETGGTLAANGLKKCVKLFDSSAVLVMRAADAGWSEEMLARANALCNRLAASGPLPINTGTNSKPARLPALT